MQFPGVPAEHAREAHLTALDTTGWTIVPDAIPASLLAQLNGMFDRVVGHPEHFPTAMASGRPADNGDGMVEFYRAYEIDPMCKVMMDLPTVFPIAEEAYRRRGGEIRLLSGPDCQHVPADTGSSMHWHHDSAPVVEAWQRDGAQRPGVEDGRFGGVMGGYLRLTYILSDLEPGGGGTAMVPGSHHLHGEIPDWANGPDGPRAIPGMVTLVARAGSCVINWTRVWHTRTPNRSTTDTARRVFWQVYRRSDQPVWAGDDINLTRQFVEAETDPARRRLLGACGWEARWLEKVPRSSASSGSEGAARL